MAVIGRQKLQRALSAQQPIRPSAPETLSIAKSRACSTSVSFFSAAIVRNMRLNISMGVVALV